MGRLWRLRRHAAWLVWGLWALVIFSHLLALLGSVPFTPAEAHCSAGRPPLAAGWGLAASEAVWPTRQHQLCMRHKMGNAESTFSALAHVPKGKRAEVHTHLKAIFYQADQAAGREQAVEFGRRYRHIYPEAVACLEKDLERCLTFYQIPAGALALHSHEQRRRATVQ